MGMRELSRVREIALALPEVSERRSHGALCFFILDKRPLCYYHDDHRGDGRISLWCPAYPDLRDDRVLNHPQRFFKPQTSSSGTFCGWLGAYLDTTGENAVDWQDIATIVEDAYRKIAPKRLVALLEKNQRQSGE